MVWPHDFTEAQESNLKSPISAVGEYLVESI